MALHCPVFHPTKNSSKYQYVIVKFCKHLSISLRQYWYLPWIANIKWNLFSLPTYTSGKLFPNWSNVKSQTIFSFCNQAWLYHFPHMIAAPKHSPIYHSLCHTGIVLMYLLLLYNTPLENNLLNTILPYLYGIFEIILEIFYILSLFPESVKLIFPLYQFCT